MGDLDADDHEGFERPDLTSLDTLFRERSRLEELRHEGVNPDAALKVVAAQIQQACGRRTER